ncbi:Fe(3+)-hydroxamate ABC transporter permease FhuB [Pseudohoeflea suaedae]|uniref:Fe(3+)-hydroxamate ABC transporter permease FhuB n=1 Tax=Pseudohoeflea suaedae TaxID=877384 RepID=A0A4V3A775_9HYPH|nr:Fe(3+)-hydroxamate ABC transporter permease FhuB [Pseudohoeflea suaedae]TDH37645.1 Fe(3+)-hydroxamate ABC transporter permease FhuB [Pseudohoeflea suaedae]
MRRSATLLWACLAVLAAILFALRIDAAWPGVVMADELDRVILFQTVLPRAAVAILAGAALGLSGLLLQRVLRNALAEPSTLGISAGAQLAMALATLFLPGLMAVSPQIVAFAGGALAVSLCLLLTWRRGLEPVSVVLAGMMVALTATSASAALILANGDYLFSLFIWGGGSLTQQSWQPALSILPVLAIGFVASLLLLRPLTILGLDDQTAKSLGLAVNAGRLAILALAVWLATTVVAEVGVIGFIGLAAPALAGLSGARTLGEKLFAAPLIGAILLWTTDGLVQLFADGGGERIPTGAATALLGGPLLLWLLPRLRMMEWPSLGRTASLGRRARRPLALALTIALGGFVIALLALVIGKGPDGWMVAHGTLLSDLAGWRWPRILVAASAGAMLAGAGVMVQRLTGNPLASPEVLGVGSGAGAGLAGLFAFNAAAGMPLQFVAASAGALGALLLILAVSARAKFGPERLLLGGIAVGAACGAIITAVIALGTMQSYTLLSWLTGSTAQTGGDHAVAALIAAIVLLCPAMLTVRWLDILQLGTPVAASLGVPLGRARLSVVVLAALMTAIASLYVGPLSFVGLIAPHLARLMGLTRSGHQLAGAVALGAGLLVLSDWLARTLIFPYQLPVGLLASLIGGPYLVYLLSRGVPSRA